MESQIRTADLSSCLPATRRANISKTILNGEIEGMETIFHSLLKGDVLTLVPEKGRGRVLLFVSGKGRADNGGMSFAVTEVALLAPKCDAPLAITAIDTPLEVLELVIALSPEDLAVLQNNREKYPFFITYSECKTYRERIKSEKTVNRTLLPELVFPRLAVGSVQTTGPDRVGAHEHPMLEQLFFGLKGNHCLVRADEHEALFGESVLLHIPLGSTHGVEVEAPNELHYIWIDLFRNQADMDYIAGEHIANDQ